MYGYNESIVNWVESAVPIRAGIMGIGAKEWMEQVKGADRELLTECIQ